MSSKTRRHASDRCLVIGKWQFFVIRGVEIALASVVPAMNGFIESFGSHARFLVDSIYAMRNQGTPGVANIYNRSKYTRDRNDATNRLRQNAQKG